MSNKTAYKFTTEIHNNESNSIIPDIEFHPTQSLYVVSYSDNHQVRIHDADTNKVTRIYQNPEAQLDWPHGVAVTERHIIVSNRCNTSGKGAIFNVFRIDADATTAPVTTFTSPFDKYWEIHSLDIDDERFLVTYYGDNNGAIVAYNFDDETGVISGPTDVQESFFSGYGSPKGISFNSQGNKAVVTFVTEKKYTHTDKLRQARKILAQKNGAAKFIGFIYSRLINAFRRVAHDSNGSETITNGIVVFEVDEKGRFSKQPVQIILKQEFCRLENVAVFNEICAIADPVNGTVNLYQYNGDEFPDMPAQVLNEHLSFPHDACFSVDGKTLVISNYGLEVIDGRPQWEGYVEPRSDKITVYKLQH